MQKRKGIKQIGLLGLVVVGVALLTACSSGVKQSDYDAVKQQLATAQQDSTKAKQDLQTAQQRIGKINARERLRRRVGQLHRTHGALPTKPRQLRANPRKP